MIEPQAEEAVEPILSTMELNLEIAAKRLAVGRPKQCACNGHTLADLCQRYMVEPKASTRDAIIAMPVRTRSDAMAVLSVLERGEDAELASHLLQGLRVHLSAA